MDTSTNYLSDIQSAVDSNKVVADNIRQKEEYNKAGMDWWKEPAEILGSQLAEGSIRHIGGKVLKKVGLKTGSTALTNLGNDIQSGKDIKASLKTAGKEITTTAQNKLEQAGEQMRNKIISKTPMSLEEQRQAIREKVLLNKKARKSLRKNKRLEEPKKQLNKRQTIEQKTREGRASNFDDPEISKPMITDPFTGREIIPKSKTAPAEPTEPIIDPDTGKEIEPEEDIIEKKQETYDPENPQESEILKRTEQERRERSTAQEQETKKSPSQAIEDLQQKISPPPLPEGEGDKSITFDDDEEDDFDEPNLYEPPKINPAEQTEGLDPSKLPDDAGFKGAGGQTIKAQRPDSPVQEQEPTFKDRQKNLKDSYKGLSKEGKSSYKDAVNRAGQIGLDENDLESREMLMNQVVQNDRPTGGGEEEPDTGTKSTDTSFSYSDTAQQTTQADQDITKQTEEKESKGEEDEDEPKPEEDEELGDVGEGLDLGSLADPLLGIAGLGLALAPLFEGKPSAPSPPPQSELLNPSSQFGNY